MITTILIVLVAVVVLIVIIAVLALRYLRADDSDTFDDIPDEPRPRRSPEAAREPVAAGKDRRPRPAPVEPVTEARAAEHPSWPSESRGQASHRERSSVPRPAAGGRAPSQPGAARREPSATSQKRAGRPTDADALTSSWDSLSDVDYWAELAADKPQVTPAPAAAGRRGSNAGPGPDARQPATARQAARAEQDQRPVAARKRALPHRPAGAPPARAADHGQAEQIDARGGQAAARYSGDIAAGKDGQGADALRGRTGTRAPAAPLPTQATAGQRAVARPSTGPGPAHPPRPLAPASPAAPASHPGAARSGSRGPADDDPLTSPSFPAINSSDSRSYRGRRSGASGQHARPANPSHQYIEYSSAPDRGSSRPNGYPVQPPSAQPPAQPPARPALPAATAPAAASDAANPYGSYVTASQPAHSDSAPGYPQSGYLPAAFEQTTGPGAAGPSQGGYAAGQPAGTWYAAPTVEPGSALSPSPGQPADGYLPGVGFPGSRSGAHSRRDNGSAPRSYPAIDYSSLTYDDPVYPDGGRALTSYGAHRKPTASFDQHGHSGPDAGYGPDGYQGYPGYAAGGR